MRRSVIAVALVVAAIFAAGYLIGQIRGITPSSAASGSPGGQGTFRLGPFDHFGPGARGQVTAVNGDTVTITPATGWRGQQSSVTTIVLTGSTQYFAGRAGSATKSDVKVGTYVVAEGTLSADGKTLTASRVMVLTGAPTFKGGARPLGQHADGTVTVVNGDTITLKPDTNQGMGNEDSSVTTIVLTGSTQYSTGFHGGTATRDSIKVGTFIVALGTLSGDGKTLTATQVILPMHTGAWAQHGGAWTPNGSWAPWQNAGAPGTHA